MKCWPAIIAICVLVSIETTAGHVVTHPVVPSKRAEKSAFESPDFVEEQSIHDLCLTAECNQTASTILRNMNSSVDPCDNFYNFACGGFSNSPTMYGSNYVVNPFSVLKWNLLRELKTIIEDIEPNASKPYALVKTLYKNCMNTEATDLQGLEPFRELLEEHGGWPVLHGTWDETKLDTRLVIDYFSSFSITPDPENNTSHIMTIEGPKLGLDRAYLSNGFNDDKVQAYYNYMVNVSVILGADVNLSKSDLKESLLFEIDMAKNTLRPEKIRGNYEKMTVKQLMNNYASLPWDKYFHWHLSPVAHVSENDIVIVTRPTYIANMEKLISNTSKRIQANYAMWMIAYRYAEFLTEGIRESHRNFIAATSGYSAPTSPLRWVDCVDSVRGSLGLSLNAIYLKQHANSSVKSDITEIVANVKDQFDEMLRQAEWLDNKTRGVARAKLKRLSSNIQYHDELILGKEVNDYYQNLEWSEGIYFRNRYNITRFKERHEAGKLRKSVKWNDWIVHGSLLGVNAHYFHKENIIEVFAAILQDPFYNIDRPKYMNYGAIGCVAGHEITHGFDNKGRFYDEHGNLKNWWTSGEEKSFLKKAQCIINQYGNYTLEAVGLNINGIKTQGENIADNGGARAAYRAYRKWAAGRKEKTLPGLRYTSKQLFWISLANSLCTKITPNILENHIKTGVYSPNEFRIIGTVSNMPEFSKDFNCTIGSNMNPVEKCTVW